MQCMLAVNFQYVHLQLDQVHKPKDKHDDSDGNAKTLTDL